LRAALAAVALVATLLALYVQLFERRSGEAEDRLAAARLEEALAGSRVRLKAEIVAQLRAELTGQGSTGSQGDQPRPDTVLRRGESGGSSALQQVQGSQAASRARLQESLDALARETEQADGSLRRDLEETRAEVRREREVSGKTQSLLLAALIPLVLHLLASLWPRMKRKASPEDAP
jgi:hypothetical protein